MIILEVDNKSINKNPDGPSYLFQEWITTLNNHTKEKNLKYNLAAEEIRSAPHPRCTQQTVYFIVILKSFFRK